MRNRIVQRILAPVATAAALAMVVAGCGGNDVTGTGNGNGGGGAAGAPKLPPTSTMVFQPDFFGVQPPAPVSPRAIETGKLDPATLQAAAAGDHTNFITAYVRALFVHLLVYDALEEPIGAFAAAINAVPQAQPDGSYLWTYIFVEGPREYSVFLYGTPQVDRVQWRLEVSSNDPAMPLDHFVWFDGESMNDDSGGFWQFYEPVDSTNGVQSARIDWANGATNSLTITVNGATQPDVGDSLVFTESATMGSITYTDASAGETTTITWYADGTGSITAPDYNGGLPACWDSQQVNTTCP